MIWFELGPFTIFDIETTGMSPVQDRIVELAALRVDCDGNISHFHSLINPGVKIPSRAMNVHHITDEMVKNELCFAKIGYNFLEFAQKSTLVAHNARFDLGFLQESLARNGLPLWKGKTLDSLILMKRTFPKLPSYKLQSLRAYFKLENTGEMVAHRAASDVEWTRQILEIALTKAIKMSEPQPKE